MGFIAHRSLRFLGTGVLALALVVGASFVSYSHCGQCGSGTKEEVKEEAKVGTAGPALNTGALKALFDSDTSFVLIDARTRPRSWIPGTRFLSVDADKDDVKTVVKDKDALVVTYCGGPKCPLSSKLAERLRSLGYENVVECPDGIEGWTNAGHEVKAIPESSGRK